jgi:hypothetical protein
VFNAVEIPADFFNPEGIANGDDGFTNFLWAQIQVIDGASVVDNQF